MADSISTGIKEQEVTSASANRVGGLQGWRAALRWGIVVALVQRAVLTVWMALAWLIVGTRLGEPLDRHNHALAALPPFHTRVGQLLLGVWRRWDVVEYLNLAQNGYRPADPHSSVYGLLTPFSIRALDAILPGPIDVAGAVFGLVAFAAALVLLYRVVQVYYGGERLAQASVVGLAILPLGYFFSAPMSDAVYLAGVLGMFLAAKQDRWLLAGLSGLVAALARNQGAALAAFAGLALLLSQPADLPLLRRAWDTIKRGWPLLFIPACYLIFILYRASRGLPPLVETYYDYSFHFFVDPLTGAWINLRYFVNGFPVTLLNPDFLAMAVVPLLIVLTIRAPRHRIWPFVAYDIFYFLTFISKVNWVLGSHNEILYSISVARYSLALFPLTVYLADLHQRWQARQGWHRVAALTLVIVSVAGLLALSAAHALGYGPN